MEVVSLARRRRPLALALLCGAALAPAHAADPACESAATQKALTGNARAGFVRQCEADAALIVCDTQAVDRKLADAARGRFIEQCLADTALKSASPACDAQATERKLAGSGRSAFMKKCVAAEGGGAARR